MTSSRTASKRRCRYEMSGQDSVYLLVLNRTLGNRNDPLGARLVAAAVEEEGISVALFQERLDGRDGLLAKLSRNAEGALAVFISVVPGTRNLLDFVRSVATSVGGRLPLVLGGAGARHVDVGALSVANPVVVVRGMGELAAGTIARMLRERGTLDPSLLLALPNLTYAIDGQIGRTRDSHDADVVDLVPSAAGLSEAIQRGDTISASTSTGCDGSCVFCAIRQIERTCRWRRRSCAVLEQWLRRIVAAGGSEATIDIVDDAIAAKTDHLEAVSKTFVRVNQETGARLTWRASTRVDHVVDQRRAEAERRDLRAAWFGAKQSGLRSIFLGLESGSRPQLRRFGKRATPEQNVLALEECRALGIAVETGFIPIDPLAPSATWRDEMRANVEMAIRANCPQTCPTWLSPVRVFDGAPLAWLLAKKGLLGQEIPGTGEYTYEYLSPDLADFVQALGPALSVDGNPLRDVRRLGKVAFRYAGGPGEPICGTVEQLVVREIRFVQELLDAASPAAVASAQMAYRCDALTILGDAATIAAKTRQAVLIATLDAAQKHVRGWLLWERRDGRSPRAQRGAAPPVCQSRLGDSVGHGMCHRAFMRTG